MELHATPEEVNDGLTHRQAMAMPYLASAPSLAEAAQAANVHRSTLHRWMKDPVFRDELERMRGDAINLAYAELQGIALKSVSVLADLLDDPSPRVRNMAARTALHNAVKVKEARENHHRLDLLDRAITLLKKEM